MDKGRLEAFNVGGANTGAPMVTRMGGAAAQA
jgi:hypothetical protein